MRNVEQLRFKNGKTEPIINIRNYPSGKTFIETSSGYYLRVEYLVVKPVQHIGCKYYKRNPISGKYEEVADILGFEYKKE